MNTSSHENTDETASEYLEKNTKVLAHLKSFEFFVFLQPEQEANSLGINGCFIPEKIEFKSRIDHDRVQENKSTDNVRQIRLWFYNLTKEEEVQKGVTDLKTKLKESKIKIIAHASESQLIRLIERLNAFEVDYTSSLSIILLGSGMNNDLAKFLGWNGQNTFELNEKLISYFDRKIEQWIKAAPVKIDLWTVEIETHQDGSIEQLTDQEFLAVGKKKVIDGFMSHLSLGYHPKLLSTCGQKGINNYGNKFKFGVEKIKNFCCLGTPSMKASTGIASISFSDDNNIETEICKELRDGDEIETEFEFTKESKPSQSVLSFVLSNLDRFHNEALNIAYKPDDGKLELLLFESASSFRKIKSVKGEICLKIESEKPVELQVGSNIYRLRQCKEIKIKHCTKVRMAISKEELEC